MHIGFYSPGWPVNEYPSGIVTYVHILRTELINQGHRVSVFSNVIGPTNRDPGIHLVEPTAKFIFLKLLNWLRQRGLYDVFYWGDAIGAKVRDVNHADPIDVLEMEESFGWCADVQKVAQIPIVVKLHGPEFLTQISALAQDKIALARIEMEGKALRQMAAIVSPSQSTLADTVSRYDLHPTIGKAIPNPVSVQPDLKLWDLEGCDRKTILFVGQFSMVKGGDTVLIAFRKLLEIDDSLKLFFVGPDTGVISGGGMTLHFNEFRDSLFTEAQRSNISYLGQLPREEISDLRGKAMLNIIYSRWENQPNTVLEAMIQGCPIVAGDVGGISEIIEHGVTGLLARRDNVDDLCQKVMSLINDPARARQLGENARRFVTDRHSVDKLTKDTVDVYRHAVMMAKGRKR